MPEEDNRETPQGDGVGPSDSTGRPYTDDLDARSPQEPRYPEPPASWPIDSNPATQGDPRPDQNTQPQQDIGLIGMASIRMDAGEAREFERGRKFVSAAQITALVSLFIGGVALSTVSVVLAILGYRSLSRIASKRSSDPLVQGALKRSGIIAIIMAVLALVINVVSLIAFYPMFMEMIQQGNLSGVLPGGGQVAPNGSGSSPGTSLFG